ncbi:ComEA family DNA-binding protein [Desulfocastanea catecholica]
MSKWLVVWTTNHFAEAVGVILSDLQRAISGDGRLTVMLCLLFGLLLYDLMAVPHCPLLKEKMGNGPHKYLDFIQPNQIVVAKGSGRGDTPVPAPYTPFFFLPVPINSADKELLMTIKGIGPALADTIVSYREQFGPLKNSLDLQNLHGIGARRAASLTTELTFIEVP